MCVHLEEGGGWKSTNSRPPHDSYTRKDDFVDGVVGVVFVSGQRCALSGKELEINDRSSMENLANSAREDRESRTPPFFSILLRQCVWKIGRHMCLVLVIRIKNPALIEHFLARDGSPENLPTLRHYTLIHVR